MHRLSLSVILMLLICGSLSAKSYLNPIQFGLFEAKTATDRYEVLYRTHCEAKKTNTPVSYRGIKRIDLEIPYGAKRIPLTEQTDFAGASIYVTNNTANVYLFELSQEVKSIDVTNSQVDKGSFKDVPDLVSGRYLVIIEDSTPWVKQRIGYNYGATRKDVLLVVDGKAKNHTISPYDNSWSRATATYCPVTAKKKRISNLKLYRNPGNRNMAFFVNIANQDNVVLSNISIYTPKDSLVNDVAITISNCTNVKLENVTIDGTYSRLDYSGYGITMDNVWNSRFYRLKAHGNWGVFGDNNINKATFKNCDINRFDIHCYGRDVYFSRCVIRDVYNQFSSVFGEVVFKNCLFSNCFPVAFGSSYNSYTKFNLIVKDCVVTNVGKKNCFIMMNGFNNPEINERPELTKREWPNIYVDGLIIFVENNQDYYLTIDSNKPIQMNDESIPTKIVLNRIKIQNQTQQ